MDIVLIVLIVIFSIILVASLLFLFFKKEKKVPFLTTFLSSIIISTSSYGLSIFYQKEEIENENTLTFKYDNLNSMLDYKDYLSPDLFFSYFNSDEIYTDYYFFYIVTNNSGHVSLVYKKDGEFYFKQFKVKILDNVLIYEFYKTKDEPADLNKLNYVPLVEAIERFKRFTIDDYYKIMNEFNVTYLPVNEYDEFNFFFQYSFWSKERYDFLESSDIPIYYYDYKNKCKIEDFDLISENTPLIQVSPTLKTSNKEIFFSLFLLDVPR